MTKQPDGRYGVPPWPSSSAVVSYMPSATAAAEQSASVAIEKAPLASQPAPDVKSV